MRVTYLELENIKSYHDPTRVEFTDGLNAIWGANGSGKSTILEAIGYALFDYSSYSHAAFVREGERAGTIRVGLLARDEREYEIVRRIGAGGQYYVTDIETGARLADRKDDVQAWVRSQALDIEGEVDLAAIFKNAVGVPQGLVTSDFLQSAASRKAIFDPLLRVEEYRAAYDYLRETAGYLRDRSAQLDQEIARLEVDAGRIPDAERDFEELESQVRHSEEKLASLVARVGSLEAEKRVLDAVEERARSLQERSRTAEYDVRRFGDLVEVRRRQLDEAEAAGRIVAGCEAGFRTVERAREVLADLERKRRERDALERRHADARAAMREINGWIQRLDRERLEALEAAKRAETLQSAVVEQDQLEARVHQLDVGLAGMERLGAQLHRLQTERTGLAGQIDRCERRLVEAQAAAARLESLPALQEELTLLHKQLAPFDLLKDRAENVKRTGAELKERRGRLLQDSRRHQEILQEIAAQRPRAETLEEMQTEERAVREERARILSAVEYGEQARADLLGARCPLLDLTCPVVAADAGMLERLGDRERALSKRSAELDQRLIQLEADVRGARTAADAVGSLVVEEARLSRSESELAEVEAALRQCADEFATLSDRLGDEDRLKRREEEFGTALRGLQAESGLAAEVPSLTAQLERDRGVLALQDEELAGLQSQWRAVHEAEQERAELQARLAELEDPRQEAQRLLAAGGRRAEVEASLAQQQARLVEAMDRVKAIGGQLAPYERLDDEMEQQQRLLAEHGKAYERYLSARDEAEQVPARREALAEAESVLDEAERNRSSLEQQRREVLRDYREEEHARLKSECEEAHRAVVAEGAGLEHLVEQRARVDRDLTGLRRQRERLQQREGERDELKRVADAIGFIRDTIRSAGPAVTESLLASISQTANDIYAEIMDDHASELRWDRDYEVIVQRGPEERSFGQLSGGEQMGAALAVRLALLKEMSEVHFAFFDEPTQNMDAERRTNLAQQIGQIRGFDQLIVISHDDTFEHHTEHLVRLRKEHDTTYVEGS